MGKREFGIFRYSEVPDYDDPSLLLFRRWNLIKTPWFCIKVHHLMRSDSPDRGLHDHPWSFLSIRLWRNYTELRPRDTLERHTFWSFRRAEDFHRVIVDDPKRGCWTLVINGPSRRTWGFRDSQSSHGWVAHNLADGPRLRKGRRNANH